MKKDVILIMGDVFYTTNRQIRVTIARTFIVFLQTKERRINMPRPGKITLESGASHFYCGGCGNTKSVKQGVYKGLVAYSNGDDTTSEHYVVWKLLCKECYTGEKESKEKEKVIK